MMEDVYFECFKIDYNPSGVVIELGTFGRKPGAQTTPVGTIRCSHAQVDEGGYK
jgi:hypothetical protein